MKHFVFPACRGDGSSPFQLLLSVDSISRQIVQIESSWTVNSAICLHGPITANKPAIRRKFANNLRLMKTYAAE